MIALNLIPESLREARASARRMRLWSKCLAGVAVCATAAGAWFATREHPARAGWAAVGEIEAKIDARKRELASLRARSQAMARQVESIDAVSNHPDWSGVLALLAQRMSDALVLESCVLNRSRAARGAVEKGSQPREEYTLELAGVATGQAAVHQYVSDLQAEKVFDVITLMEMRSRVLNGREMVSFRLTCSIIAPSDLATLTR